MPTLSLDWTNIHLEPDATRKRSFISFEKLIAQFCVFKELQSFFKKSHKLKNWKKNFLEQQCHTQQCLGSGTTLVYILYQHFWKEGLAYIEWGENNNRLELANTFRPLFLCLSGKIDSLLKDISLFIRCKKLNWHKTHTFYLMRDAYIYINPAKFLRLVDAIERERSGQ